MATAQDRAHDALQPLLVLSASANSPSAAVQLIKMATSAPNAFFFAELLETANIQSLKHGGEQYAPWVTLLEIFSWATWRDYECESHLDPTKQEAMLQLQSSLTLTSNAQPPRPRRTASPQAPPPHAPDPRVRVPNAILLASPALAVAHQHPLVGRPGHQRHRRRAPDREALARDLKRARHLDGTRAGPGPGLVEQGAGHPGQVER